MTVVDREHPWHPPTDICERGAALEYYSSMLFNLSPPVYRNNMRTERDASAWPNPSHSSYRKREFPFQKWLQLKLNCSIWRILWMKRPSSLVGSSAESSWYSCLVLTDIGRNPIHVNILRINQSPNGVGKLKGTVWAGYLVIAELLGPVAVLFWKKATKSTTLKGVEPHGGHVSDHFMNPYSTCEIVHNPVFCVNPPSECCRTALYLQKASLPTLVYVYLEHQLYLVDIKPLSIVHISR